MQTFWGPDDRRRTGPGFAAWTGELEVILVSQAWAISLLHGHRPDLAARILEASKTSLVHLRYGPDAAGGPYENVDVEGPVLAYMTRALGGGGPYGLDLAFQPVSVGVVAQLADAVVRLELRDDAQAEHVFQVLGHIRNAIAHGGIFDIRRSAHRYLPTTSGSVTITASMDGDPLTDHVGPGDILSLVREAGAAALRVLPGSR